MGAQTAKTPGNGTGTLAYTLASDSFDIESVYVAIDNSVGATAVTAELEVKDQSGVVIARKKQATTIPAGGTGSATWALRLDDESAGGGTDPLAVHFATSPQPGTFLETDTTGDTTLNQSGAGQINIHSDDGAFGGGFIGITTDDGEVFIGSTSIVNRLAAGGAFEVQDPAAFQVFRIFDTRDFQVRAKTFDIGATANFVMSLPTVNPGGANRLWNNGGVVNIT